MAVVVRIQNRITKVISDIPNEIYEARRNTKSFSNAYTVVAIVSEPPEVKTLRKKLKDKAAGNK